MTQAIMFEKIEDKAGLIGIISSLSTIVTITFCDAFTQKARRKIFPAADTLLFITDSLVLVTAVTSTCCVPHSFPVVIVGLLLLAGVAHLRSRYTDTAHIHSVLPGQRQHDCVSSWLTSFRALMMLTTCIVIFAVDLPIFPKESAKSIKYGFTLMDLGVGAMTYAAGFVTGLQHRSTNSSLFSSGILMLLLGLFRLILVKMADYHEQVIEYGVHWNFFFSLGAMFLLHSLFVIFDALDEVVWGAAVVVLGFANHFLFHTYDFAEFVFEAPRTNIFSQNREGFFGLIGFVILFQLAYRAGRTTLLCAEDAPRFFPRWCLAALVGFISVTQSGISSSRRLVNLPYIFMVTFLCSAVLHIQACISKIFQPYRPSPVLLLLNRYALEAFLIANVLTGIANQVIPLDKLNSLIASLLLGGYTLAILGVVKIMSHCDARLKRVLPSPTQLNSSSRGQKTVTSKGLSRRLVYSTPDQSPRRSNTTFPSIYSP